MITNIKWFAIGLVLSAAMMTGCNTGMVSSSVGKTTNTLAPDGTQTVVTEKNDVLAMRGTMLVNTEVDKTNIKWGDVNIGVGGYSTSGDTDSINAIGNAIVNGIIAYGTAGGATAAKAAVMTTLLATQPGASTNAPAMK